MISILLPDLRGGGVERIRIVLAHEFARAGHDVEFVLMQARGELLEEARASFSVVDLAVTRARGLPLALARYLRRRRPGALLAAMWPLTVIAPLAARLSGHRCKVIVSEHGMLSAEYCDWGVVHRALLRLSAVIGYRMAHHRIGVSSGLVQDMANLSWMQKSEFSVIYNPVSPRASPDVNAMAVTDSLWGVRSGARIITVGTMKAVKNHHLLLEAFAQLTRSDARLMFVGDGPGREALLALAQKLGVADRVILTGFQLDPTPFYMSSDVFVLSSNLEGFGNVIVEAMACGTPVVSTDCPSGPREILNNGKYGRLTPVGNEDAMAAAILQSLDDAVPKELLKARAAEFNLVKAAAAYLKLLE